ncbi:GMC family oxidoreductase N-terminal domain-containing protein [Parasphingopyxis sp.]|uniref:GMC family oxidoreductase n=1 Tax=Parasphingopyxis sp. TaxID=1920299 RepID=UPI00262CCB21|nr:GMC family oxidoreductase N-terminal domain-containing protein [Parasphingopyxis sp.]
MAEQKGRHIVIVGGGTAGSVLAARLSEDDGLWVTLLEAGPDESAYDSSVFDPARAPDAWLGVCPIARTLMHTDNNAIPILQGRMLGGTSAVNGLATLRGLPEDYDGWAASGLEGWGWQDVVDTFKAAETDMDFGAAPLHGDSGPLTVRRWRRDEMSHAQLAFLDGMIEAGSDAVADINDPGQLPGIGVFPVTIDADGNRLTTSLAYLPPAVRQRENLVIRTNSQVTGLHIEGRRAAGVILENGEQIEAGEVVIAAGALWSPVLLMRSGVGPAAHLTDHGIGVVADLPVGETQHDHLGPGVPYRHEGPRGGTAGPAQSLYIGASNGTDVDYHLFPIAPAATDGPTDFNMAAFLLRSSGQGTVRLGESPEADPIVTAPPLPDDGMERLRHAFDRLAAWERSDAFRESGCTPLIPYDLTKPDAVSVAIERGLISYGHMTGTCPMGSVLDADCRVLGMEGLRVVDASVMPTIPSGNTYLGCVMIAERVARKMRAGS